MIKIALRAWSSFETPCCVQSFCANPSYHNTPDSWQIDKLGTNLSIRGTFFVQLIKPNQLHIRKVESHKLRGQFSNFDIRVTVAFKNLLSNNNQR